MRRILGNLLVEEDWRQLLRPGLKPALPRQVIDTVSGAATLLRVFADEGDRLWTPAPVDPARMCEVPGLPRPVLESGDVKVLPRADEEVTWGRVDEISAAVNHRAFGLKVAQDLGCALPCAKMVASMADLAEHLAATGLSCWVVKAPLSAAGRERHIERCAGGLGVPQTRHRLEGLFTRHGSLLFEPWLARTEDLGTAAYLYAEDPRLASFHRQLVDDDGRFYGIELLPLSAIDLELSRTVEAVGDALRRAGYVGPFGVDAWRYRDPSGTVRLNPLGEINARMTFGLVAVALAERFGSCGRLVFGRRMPEGRSVVPLLMPGGASRQAAWWEVTP
jgi:hypothetical protein